MGLLDLDMSTPEGQGFNSALMAAAQALLTPRSQGGGMGAAFGAFPQAIDRAKQNAMREQLMALQRQQVGLQTQEMQRKAQAQALQQQNLQRLIAGLPPEQQAAALVAPEKFAESMVPQKPELVTIFDDQGREQKAWSRGPGVDMTPVGGAKRDQPPELTRYLQARDSLPEGHPWRGIYDQQIAKMTTHSPGTKVEVNMGQKGFENTQGLRKEFNALPESKAFKEMQSTADIIRGALTNASPANDLAAATKFMKMLDPGSVVRESELGMAMSATGMLDRALNYANMIVNGHKLTPQQRKDFYEATNRIMDAATSRYNALVGDYRQEAQVWGLREDSIAKPAPVMPSVDDLMKKYGQ